MPREMRRVTGRTQIHGVERFVFVIASLYRGTAFCVLQSAGWQHRTSFSLKFRAARSNNYFGIRNIYSVYRHRLVTLAGLGARDSDSSLRRNYRSQLLGTKRRKSHCETDRILQKLFGLPAGQPLRDVALRETYFSFSAAL
jgi:hypothetical protein